MTSEDFDPSWYHAEDMEVSLKLIANGGSIVYAPEAVVAHVAESGRSDFWLSVQEMQEPMLEYCESIQSTAEQVQISILLEVQQWFC